MHNAVAASSSSHISAQFAPVVASASQEQMNPAGLHSLFAAFHHLSFKCSSVRSPPPPCTSSSSSSSPLHADPGCVKDAHQPQHSLQDDSDDIRRHAQRADLRQRFGLDVPHRTLCLIDQRLRGRRNKQLMAAKEAAGTSRG